jgi:hypothetical protein
MNPLGAMRSRSFADRRGKSRHAKNSLPNYNAEVAERDGVTSVLAEIDCGIVAFDTVDASFASAHANRSAANPSS